jgi:hypothetical protein
LVEVLSDAIGLVEKVVAVAQRLLCVLVDRDRDGVPPASIALRSAQP